MEWKVNSERSLYTDAWLDLRLADVELPDGRRLDHRLLRMRASAGAVLVRDRHVLLIWRHRFITGRWSWEIPMGGVEAGESPIAAAARETEEETGWRPAALSPLATFTPSSGISDSVHHIFRGTGAVRIGPPTDPTESSRIEWVPLSDVPALIAKQEIVNSSTAAALLYVRAE